MTSNKFLAAFLSFALVIVGTVVTIAGPIGWQAVISITIIALTAASTLLLPLIPSLKWQGILKTGIPVLLAVLNGVTPLILGGVYDHQTVGLLLLNGLQVLAAEIGVQVRTFPTTPVSAVYNTTYNTPPAAKA